MKTDTTTLKRLLTLSLITTMTLTGCTTRKNSSKETYKDKESITKDAITTILDIETTTDTFIEGTDIEVEETILTPETTMIPETIVVPETTKTPETTKVSETTKIPETTKVPETTKAPETTKKEEPSNDDFPTTSEAFEIQLKEIKDILNSSSVDSETREFLMYYINLIDAFKPKLKYIDEINLNASTCLSYAAKASRIKKSNKKLNSPELGEYASELSVFKEEFEDIQKKVVSLLTTRNCLSYLSRFEHYLINKNYKKTDFENAKHLQIIFNEIIYTYENSDVLIERASTANIKKLTDAFDPIYEKAAALVYELTGLTPDEYVYATPSKISVYEI